MHFLLYTKNFIHKSCPIFLVDEFALSQCNESLTANELNKDCITYVFSAYCLLSDLIINTITKEAFL